MQVATLCPYGWIFFWYLKFIIKYNENIQNIKSKKSA